MIANYHTHTWRCRHAEPDEEAYVRTAYDAGIRLLGFADHVPQPFEHLNKNHFSAMRMTCDQLPDYMQTLLSLKEKYKDMIDIHIGFEAEYYPDLFPHLLEMLKPWPCEYLILGQHLSDNEFDGIYFGAPGDANQMHKYIEQCKRAMDTGAYTYFAHPDMCYLVGDEKTYRQYARELCRAAKSYHLPLEFNLLGFITHRHYPNPIFWEEVAAVGNQVVLGWDAHSADWMSQTDKEAEARAFLDSLGLKPLEYVTLVSPFENM